MSRQLKFRQWVPTDLHPEGEFYYWGYGVMPDPAEFVPPTRPDLPSEQYINMQDRNGIKIYEGDELRYLAPNGKEVISNRKIVKYGPGAGFNIRTSQNFEIAGNVHEGSWK